jgi:hypothetical protein
VNNLRFSDPHGTNATIQKKVADQGGALSKIEHNCINKILVVHKPYSEISWRVDKMKKRGWTVKYAFDNENK